MPETIDAFALARTPYADSDNIGIGYGPTPRQTYRGSLSDLASYLALRGGTGQTTLVGNANYTMQSGSSGTPADFELATHSALTFSPTWTLAPANSLPAGNRRRIVDLAGAIVPGTYQIAVAPYGNDKINGSGSVWWLVSKYSYLIVETDGVSNWTVVDFGPNLLVSNNLSDLTNTGVARGNLGLGTAAVHNIGDFMIATNNLSELTNPGSSIATARVNLGLGVLSTVPSVLYSYLDPSMIATSADVASGTPNKLVPSNVVLGSRAPVNIPYGSPSIIGWDFSTFVNGLWYIPSTATTPMTLPVPTNVKPGQTGFIIIRNQGAASKTVNWPQPIFNLVPSTATSSSFAASPAANLFEYWTESTTSIRIRVTLAI
jgi:hypothetical protein